MSLKAVVFDMDGTLVDAKEWHYLALNEALSIFGEEISQVEHADFFDGLPTKVKLNALSKQNRLPPHLHDIVSAVKQERTFRYISSNLFPSVRQLLMMQWIKAQGLRIAVATNSIRPTAMEMLNRAGLIGFLDVLVTNEDVTNPKPDPEMYQVTCDALGVSPDETIVFEDNEFGVESARGAGCAVHKIELVSDLDTSLVSKIVGGD